ncbi:MAG: hypothetical protein LBC85_03370 [Fibromonadaceae bacterium]|jgi:uncharacterized protein (TIGR02145 family)|nr:hypothetical protein [Fibromonadaceae bacterium]
MTKARILSLVLALPLLVSIMLSGCSGTGGSDPDLEDWTQDADGTNILTSVFPSPKEKNPYSVENMNKIFKDLILANSASTKDIPKLEANFLYVRFLPYGRHGVHELKAYDPSLVLFRHPMDYNEIKQPVVYMDKTLPDSIIPYFASVPVGYEFGPTPYEILQELFLTQPLEEDDEDDQEDSYFVKAKKSNRANKEIAAYLKNQGLAPYHLEIAAFPNSERLDAEAGSGSSNALAKNISPDMDNTVAFLSRWSRWRPSGTLKFRDERKGDTSLVGVRVTAGYRFYWRSSRTDKDGKFQSPERWTLSVHYEAHFDHGQFVLQDGHSGFYWWFKDDLKYVKGGTSYQPWNHTFTGDHAKWCVVWTAAHDYWYGNIYGLKRPRNSLWSMDIEVYYKDNNDFRNKFGNILGDYNYTFGLENISIQANRSHLSIYGTTIHEIAHSSHYANLERRWYNSRIGVYDDLSKRLKETYATGIERYLTIKRYGIWGGSYNRVDGYTGLFEDLEDTNTTFAGTNMYCDRVSGITVPMAEKTIMKSYSWNGFKNNLMNDYPSGTLNENGGRVSYTRADMDALFEYWDTGKESHCPVEPSSSSALSSSSSVPPSSSSVLSSSSSMLPSSSSAPPSSSSVVASDDGPGQNFIDVRDGYAYKTTKIGPLIWMAENLRFNADGSKCGMPGMLGSVPGTLTDESTEHCDKYGRLYDWDTAMNACPGDWYLPSSEEWMQMQEHIAIKHSAMISGVPFVAKYLRDVNSNGEDTYGFAALSGSGFAMEGGLFVRFESYPDGDSFWWTATNEYSSISATVQISSNVRSYFWQVGHSRSGMNYVRCVRNVP